MRCVDGPRPDLYRFDELERHRDTGGTRARPLVTRWRSLTVAQVDSNVLVVRRWI